MAIGQSDRTSAFLFCTTELTRLKMKFVFFELDGTFADTEDLRAKALDRAVRHFGGSAEAGLINL